MRVENSSVVRSESKKIEGAGIHGLERMQNALTKELSLNCKGGGKNKE